MSISAATSVLTASLLTPSLTQSPASQTAAGAPPDPTQQAGQVHHHHHGGGGAPPPPPPAAGPGQPAPGAGINTVA